MITEILNSLLSLYAEVEVNELTWNEDSDNPQLVVGELTKATSIVGGTLSGSGFQKANQSNAINKDLIFQIVLNFKNKRVDIEPVVSFIPPREELRSDGYLITKITTSFEVKDPTRKSLVGTEIVINIQTTIRTN